jgi:hypothetical protein
MNKKELDELKGYIIDCKEIMLTTMRKSPDIKEVRGLSKAISKLDLALDMIG